MIWRTLFRVKSKLWSDQQGGPMIEAAFAFPVLLIVVMGLVELTNFLDAKERINKAANQAANVASTLSPSQVTGAGDLSGELNAIANSMADVMAPYGGSISIRFCEGTSQRASASQTIAGGCGMAGGSATSVADLTSCGSSKVSKGQFVSVAAGCSYAPMFDFFGLFENGTTIRSQITAHMRRNLNL